MTGTDGKTTTTFLIDAILSVALIGGVRFVIRLYTESIAAQAAPTSRNLIIVGAGNTGLTGSYCIKQGTKYDVSNSCGTFCDATSSTAKCPNQYQN